MANTFKVFSHDVLPASSGTPEALMTVQASTTTVILGLILCNVHSASVTASVKLSSDSTTTAGGVGDVAGTPVANTTTFITKDVSIPAGSSLEILTGSKLILQTTDSILIDCSVADKLSCTLSVMEIT